METILASDWALNLVESAIGSFSGANDLVWHFETLVINDPDAVGVRAAEIKNQIESHGFMAPPESQRIHES